jgi:inositol-1,3,4-trisphosphate 5/6-kinase/inositol-tetrakisphosphate 1-kinase
MTIIPSIQHLNKNWTDKYGDQEPVIIQKFIQHDGVIIKVYVADGQTYISTRPSFINVTQNTGNTFPTY